VHYDVDYGHGRKTPCFGMLFGDGALQAIDGELKRFLLKSSPAYDIDQANAIPTLVLHDARSYGHEMQQLAAYNEDREGWLARIVQEVPSCTRDAAVSSAAVSRAGSASTGSKCPRTARRTTA
jgi:hypothetical protein